MNRGVIFSLESILSLLLLVSSSFAFYYLITFSSPSSSFDYATLFSLFYSLDVEGRLDEVFVYGDWFNLSLYLTSFIPEDLDWRLVIVDEVGHIIYSTDDSTGARCNVFQYLYFSPSLGEFFLIKVYVGDRFG